VICSLLTLQIECLADKGLTGPLHDAHHRVVAMSLIHELLYHSDTLSNLDFGEYIELLSSQLYHAYCVDPARIRLELDVEPLHLTVDHAVPCGLILNELLANSLKHAFPGNREGVIRITLKRLGAIQARFSVVDNGVGLPVDFHYQETSSLGLQVVRTLIAQLKGELKTVTQGGHGLYFRLGTRP